MEKEKVNKMTDKNLSSIFGPTLMALPDVSYFHNLRTPSPSEIIHTIIIHTPTPACTCAVSSRESPSNREFCLDQVLLRSSYVVHCHCSGSRGVNFVSMQWQICLHVVFLKKWAFKRNYEDVFWNTFIKASFKIYGRLLERKGVHWTPGLLAG